MRLAIFVRNYVPASDLIKDSKKALNVLIKQPEINPKRISVIGHSEVPCMLQELQLIIQQ